MEDWSMDRIYPMKKTSHHLRQELHFDTLAAMLAALVIIPAMATTGANTGSRRTGAVIYLSSKPDQLMPGSTIIAIIFFVAVLFAEWHHWSISTKHRSQTVQEKLHVGRKTACVITGDRRDRILIDPGHRIWLDGYPIHLHLPTRAGLAGIMFFWILKEICRTQVNKGRESKIYKDVLSNLQIYLCTDLYFGIGAWIALGGIG